MTSVVMPSSDEMNLAELAALNPISRPPSRWTKRMRLAEQKRIMKALLFMIEKHGGTFTERCRLYTLACKEPCHCMHCMSVGGLFSTTSYFLCC